MSSAPVCQTGGTFATSISPPPSGVVATTLKVGSSIVSARAFAIAAAMRATASGAQRQAVQPAMPLGSSLRLRGSTLKKSRAGSPGGMRRAKSRTLARDDKTIHSSLAIVHFNCSKVPRPISQRFCREPFPGSFATSRTRARSPWSALAGREPMKTAARPPCPSGRRRRRRRKTSTNLHSFGLVSAPQKRQEGPDGSAGGWGACERRSQKSTIKV